MNHADFFALYVRKVRAQEFYAQPSARNVLCTAFDLSCRDATFGLRTWKVPKLSGSALTGENVLKAADLITSNLMRQLSGTLGLEEKDLA